MSFKNLKRKLGSMKEADASDYFDLSEQESDRAKRDLLLKQLQQFQQEKDDKIKDRLTFNKKLSETPVDQLRLNKDMPVYLRGQGAGGAEESVSPIDFITPEGIASIPSVASGTKAFLKGMGNEGAINIPIDKVRNTVKGLKSATVEELLERIGFTPSKTARELGDTQIAKNIILDQAVRDRMGINYAPKIEDTIKEFHPEVLESKIPIHNKTSNPKNAGELHYNRDYLNEPIALAVNSDDKFIGATTLHEGDHFNQMLKNPFSPGLPYIKGVSGVNDVVTRLSTIYPEISKAALRKDVQNLRSFEELFKKYPKANFDNIATAGHFDAPYSNEYELRKAAEIINGLESKKDIDGLMKNFEIIKDLNNHYDNLEINPTKTLMKKDLETKGFNNFDNLKEAISDKKRNIPGIQTAAQEKLSSSIPKLESEEVNELVDQFGNPLVKGKAIDIIPIAPMDVRNQLDKFKK